MQIIKRLVKSYMFIQIIDQGHSGVKRETVGINSFWTHNSHMIKRYTAYLTRSTLRAQSGSLLQGDQGEALTDTCLAL